MCMKAILLACILFVSFVDAQPLWQTNLDERIQFYQSTDFGILIAATDKSLYAIDGKTGEKLWRRSHRGLGETSVVPIPETDLVLLSLDRGEKSVLQAFDLFSGDTIWQSEKIKGDVMHVAIEPQMDLLSVVMTKKARGNIGEELKRTPIVHILELSSGKELWKRELDSDVEMMPAHFPESGSVSFTLDNFRPPIFLDGSLFVFYEGVTSYDARTGEPRQREKFKVNEGGLALTEADVIADGTRIFTTGRGKVRALDRGTQEIAWEAKDLGVTPEMFLLGDVLYVRTGGQFTRIRDGEIEMRGPFGISAIDSRSGKTLWRYKGADKGLTNFVFADEKSIAFADKDDLNFLDARTGKRISKLEHTIEKAQFVVINEKGETVVGGRDEIAAFSRNANFSSQVGEKRNELRDPIREVWRAKHKAPSRGILRVVGAIALRATALYFRYGGFASSSIGFAQKGFSFFRTANAFRSASLRTRLGSLDLTTLATTSARNYVSNRIYAYGSIAQKPSLLNRIPGLQIQIPTGAQIRGRITGRLIEEATPSRADVQDRLLEKLDPIRQIEKLSNYLLQRKRLAELRGNFMYYYTELPKPFDRKGLVGVNINTGKDARFILASDPDANFVTDEINGLLYSADGNRLQAFDVLSK